MTRIDSLNMLLCKSRFTFETLQTRTRLVQSVIIIATSLIVSHTLSTLKEINRRFGIGRCITFNFHIEMTQKADLSLFLSLCSFFTMLVLLKDVARPVNGQVRSVSSLLCICKNVFVGRTLDVVICKRKSFAFRSRTRLKTSKDTVFCFNKNGLERKVFLVSKPVTLRFC